VGKLAGKSPGDGVIERPDDTDRVYWLERFTDEDLCELATIIFCRPGSLRRIAPSASGSSGVSACCNCDERLRRWSRSVEQKGEQK
jgi:hypothetical protein